MDMHKQAVKRAREFSDDTEFVFEYHKKHKLWVVVDTDDSSTELFTDEELLKEWPSYEDGFEKEA